MNRPSSKRNRWEDHYARRAKKEHYPARSVYKLKEIHLKYNLIRKGDKVLDLGCSPGCWLLYEDELTGNQGWVMGVDQKPLSIKIPSHVTFYLGDILSIGDELESIGKNFNVIMSDLAPATTGKKNVDTARSFNLCQAALSIAQQKLVTGGAFICKIFQGEDFKEFLNSVKACFNKHKIFKPQSSRKASREIYIIGLDKK